MALPLLPVQPKRCTFAVSDNIFHPNFKVVFKFVETFPKWRALLAQAWKQIPSVTVFISDDVCPDGTIILI
jgi:hypothetical protein